MSIKLRTADLDDLGIIYAIRRDAILGVPPETGLSIVRRGQTGDHPSSLQIALPQATSSSPVRKTTILVGGAAPSADHGTVCSFIMEPQRRRPYDHVQTGNGIVQRGRACARLESSPTPSASTSSSDMHPLGFRMVMVRFQCRNVSERLPLNPGPYNIGLELTSRADRRERFGHKDIHQDQTVSSFDELASLVQPFRKDGDWTSVACARTITNLFPR